MVSNVGVDVDKMVEIESECAELDPSDPAQARKIASLCKPAKDLTSAATLMEIVRKEFMKIVGMKQKDWPKDCVFRVFYFQERSEFVSFMRELGENDSGTSLGYYWPMYRSLFLWNNPDGEKTYGFHSRTLATFFHETWHQFYDVLADEPPIWLNEGLAEVMAKSSIKDGGKKLLVGGLVKTRKNSTNLTRYESIQRRIAEGKHLPFRQFFRLTRDQWNGHDFGLMYGQAWAVCYWALRGGNKKLRKRLLDFFWGTTRGEPVDRLREAHFPDEDLDALEKAWLAFMEKL